MATVWTNNNANNKAEEAGNWNNGIPSGANVAQWRGATSNADCNWFGATTLNFDGWDVDDVYTGEIDIAGKSLDIDGTFQSGNSGTYLDTGGGGTITVAGNINIRSAMPAGLTILQNEAGTILADAPGNLASYVLLIFASNAVAIGVQYWGRWQSAVGPYTDGGYDHYIAGDINNASPGFGSTNAHWEMTADGILNTGSSSNAVLNDFFIAAGVTCTAAGTYIFIRQLWTTPTSLLTDGGGGTYLFMKNASNDFWQYQGIGVYEATIEVVVDPGSSGGSLTTGLAIDLNNRDFQVKRGTVVVTAGTGFNIGTGTVYVGDSLDTSKIDFQNNMVVLGSMKVLNAQTGIPTVDVGSANIALSGTFDGGPQGGGSAMTVIGEVDGSNAHAVVRGGTVQNVDISGYEFLDCKDGVIDGGGNLNVLFMAAMFHRMGMRGGRQL